jgi:signal transduction histidine kinase
MSNLVRLIRLARLGLPVLIVLVVVGFELVLRQVESGAAVFWLHLGFYGLVGPLVTFITLEWIVQQVRAREAAQEAVEQTNRRLTTVGEVLKQALAADNLEQALSKMAQQVAENLGGYAVITLEGIEGIAGRDPGPGYVLHQALPGLEGGLELRLPRRPQEEEERFLEVLAVEVAGALSDIRSRTRDILTLFEVDQALKAEANLEKLLERLLERIAEWAGAQGAGVLLLDEEGLLQPRVLRELPLEPHPFRPEGDWLKALEAPLFVQGGLLAIPLREQSPVGLLLVRGEARQLEQRLPFLRFLAAQVALAIRNAQAYLRAEELALVEERNRIAREIHDGIAQALAFMALKLDLSERLLDSDPVRAKDEMHLVKDTLRAQIREVRRSIFALRPLDLERYGFLESLRRYALAFAEQAGFRVRLELPDQLELSPASELVLLRVVQEALTNAAKHAKPSLVQVKLQTLDRCTRLEVSDNGKGFAVGKEGFETPPYLGGFGLTQMRERVEARGGVFEVVSSEAGTAVRAELPY